MNSRAFFSGVNKLATETYHVNTVAFSLSLEGTNSEERLSSQALTQHNGFSPTVRTLMTSIVQFTIL